MQGAFITAGELAGALVLRADAGGFRELIARLRDPDGTMTLVEPTATEADVRPVRAISIELADNKATIKVDGDVASLTGNSASLERMANELELFAEDEDLDEPGAHGHFDPDDGSGARYVLAADSCPLIVAGPVPDEPPAS